MKYRIVAIPIKMSTQKSTLGATHPRITFILTLFILLFCVPQIQIDSEAQITINKCTVCGRSVYNCDYKGNHPKDKETFTANGIQFTMIRVEGGSYTMGATSEQGSDAYGDEKPAHSVSVSTFYIGETEVTQVLWQAVMSSNPSYFKGSLHPVETVSWNDCQTFISKLSSLTGRKFRLPTEEEWEYAARGGNKSRHTKYSGSSDVGSVAWYDGNSGGQPHDVKTKQPNELGIYDMSGNVREWTSSYWCNDYNSSVDTSYCVYRGGGWGNHAELTRVSCRNYFTPSGSIDGLGLRLAL